MEERISSSFGCNEKVCIQTDQIYDSCRSKECIECLRVFLTETGQEVVDRAIDVKCRKAEVIWVFPNVEPLTFNRGYYTVDLTYFFRLTLEVYTGVSRPVTVEGLASFNKKVVLFGSEGSAKIFTSKYKEDSFDPQLWQKTNMPKAVVEMCVTKVSFTVKKRYNMRYKAIFFDRDGTLTYYDPEKEKWRDEIISGWSDRPFELDYDKMMSLFELAGEGKSPWYKDVDDEREFFRRYYRHLLIGEGVTEKIEERADLLHSELWCNNDRRLFDETVEILEYFQGKGYKMGVISDTSPSLKLTLDSLGISKYFTSFTASSLVGAGKPSPIIYNAALDAQEVRAEESLYVDDCKLEADGARALGFTSFWLDRRGEGVDEPWRIAELKDIIKYLNNKGVD